MFAGFRLPWAKVSRCFALVDADLLTANKNAVILDLRTTAFPLPGSRQQRLNGK